MNQKYPLLSVEAARSLEAEILGEQPSRTAFAMENAGQAIGVGILNDYQEIQNWPEFPELLVLAGKGLNTGDAFIACSLLREVIPGISVTVVMTEAEDQLNPIAGAALKSLADVMEDDLQVMTVDAYLETEPTSYDIVLDGLYGHGFRPPLRKPASELLQHVNSRTDILLRVAIDLPSGLGEEVDENCFVADITYVPGVAKTPCFEQANGAKVGRVRFLEIEPFLDQKADEKHREFIVSPNAHSPLNQLRKAHTDKRDYGHCLILAGSSQMPGAALMSSMAALQAGAGLVTTLTPSTVATQNAGTVPEAMWRPLPLTPEGGLDVETVRIVSVAAKKADAMLIGPGLVLDRTTVFALCRIIRETSLPIVLDASALTQDVVAAVIGRPLSSGPVILTPHLGEYFRIVGSKKDHVSATELMQFSQKHRAITVLKGSPTRISDGERHYIAPVGGPVLSRGGAGDILSGMMVALLAQHPEDPLSAAVQAVTWHGAAADLLAQESGAVAVRTTEMLPYLSSALRA